MGRINVLSFEVANLIAAGEVVDRPASAIKEMMENSIDAGARRITVEVNNGGSTFMRVSDDGCGMEPFDLSLAIRRHATSKIETAADLDGICTLGFRGEALAAISSVSHMRIISKSRDLPMGAMLEVDCGEAVELIEQGASDGTTIIVEDLFANVPARRKFLKRDVTETAAICANVERVALSHPEISFKLITDGQQKLETPGDGKLMNAIYSVFGKDFASKLISVEGEYEGIGVSGFIGRSDNVKGNRNYQSFYINGRYVKSKTASAALEQAFSSYLPAERFPVCVLFISMSPARVDVNVHPAKLEVKFSNEKLVFESIYYAVKQALESNVSRPQMNVTPMRRGGVAVSDAFMPVERGQSLKARQISMDMPNVQPTEISGSGADEKFAHYRVSGSSAQPQQTMSSRQYLDAYVNELKSKEKGKVKENSSGTSGTADVGEAVSYERPIITRVEDIRNAPDDGLPLRVTTEVMDILKSYAEQDQDNDDLSSGDTYDSTQSVTQGVTQDVTQDCHDNAVEGKVDDEKGVGEQVADERAAGGQAVDEKNVGERVIWRLVGEVFNSYIIVEVGEKMLIIDKHAAHERIIFEGLKAGMYASGVQSQLLLLPIEVMLMSDEVTAIEEYRGELEAVGFEFSCSGNFISVSAIPSGVAQDAVADMLAVIADRIKNGTGNVGVTRNIIFEKALYQASCKAAIKAGRQYSEDDNRWIVERLMEIPDITVCPHGRPVAMEMSKRNMDRQFERT